MSGHVSDPRETGLSGLCRAVGAMHDCVARWVNSVPVREEFQGEVAWEGVVKVFDLEGHPRATRCYAWEHETDDGKMRLVTVLHVPPVDSPAAAVKAAIVAEYREPSYFAIDPSQPIPRGPDVSYECLKCGDVIPSNEEAGAPWHCACKALMLDHDAFRSTFKEPSSARGIRAHKPG